MAGRTMALASVVIAALAAPVCAQPAAAAPWNARHAPAPSASRVEVRSARKAKGSDAMQTGAGGATVEPTGPYTSTTSPSSDLTGEDGASALAPYAAPPPGVAPPGGAPDTSTPPAGSAPSA